LVQTQVAIVFSFGNPPFAPCRASRCRPAACAAGGRAAKTHSDGRRLRLIGDGVRRTGPLP